MIWHPGVINAFGECVCRPFLFLMFNKTEKLHNAPHCKRHDICQNIRSLNAIRPRRWERIYLYTFCVIDSHMYASRYLDRPIKRYLTTTNMIQNADQRNNLVASYGEQSINCKKNPYRIKTEEGLFFFLQRIAGCWFK